VSLHTASEKPGNWPHLVVGCDCGLRSCKGAWDLGIVDYYHPNPLRMLWWRLLGKPRAKRRIAAWNVHQADPAQQAACAANAAARAAQTPEET
jgi:hypothetical protein